MRALLHPLFRALLLIAISSSASTWASPEQAAAINRAAATSQDAGGGVEQGIFRIKPLRPIAALRAEAMAAQPPKEQGTFRAAELVDLTTLDSTIKLDVRYATADNFLSTPLYEQPRAFLQRPAADALARAHRALKKKGYGLLIHDAYRPWWVTKVFWEATPVEWRKFVADPAQGSRHNRGCAVDLTLYDLKTGAAVQMPGLYDEMSERSYPSYEGGTREQRRLRDLLRATMEREGFSVYESEWWHFDFKDWQQYPILNVPFEALANPSGVGAAGPSYDYDVVIRNGRVLDGLGNPWVRADIAIKDGRFARIGAVTGRGRREIDASNDYVSPGWIDMMDQSGEVLLKNGLADNKLRQGITTAIAGEGGTPVPSAQVADYLAQLETQGISINFGSYYGTNQARAEVMGDVAGRPTAAQMKKMKAHVDHAMRGGALGIASALIYPPDSFQSTEDLIELARVAAKYDGIYATHMRDESAKLLDAIRESIEIGEQSGIQVEIFHFKGAYAPGWGKLVPEGGRLIEAARARGVNIAADMYVYPAGGTGLEITVPSWVFEQGVEQGVQRLKDPKIRERLKKEVAAGSQPGWSNLVEAAGGWHGVVLANPHNERFDRYRNRSLADIGKELGRDPADVAWDIMLEALPNRAYALFFVMSEPDIETALKFPWMSIGSDAGAAEKPGEMDAIGLPHPRAYGNAVRVIAEYVKKRNVITLEDAVRKMTSWPATRMRLYDRGAIREGLKADVTIFNYERLDDVASFENPMGSPTGIDYVLVNGELVIDQGRHTGAKPGSVLRGGGHQRLE